MADKGDITVQCPRNECGHIWNYTGDMPMATCPSCTYKCRVDENTINEK